MGGEAFLPKGIKTFPKFREGVPQFDRKLGEVRERQRIEAPRLIVPSIIANP